MVDSLLVPLSPFFSANAVNSYRQCQLPRSPVVSVMSVTFINHIKESEATLAISGTDLNIKKVLKQKKKKRI